MTQTRRAGAGRKDTLVQQHNEPLLGPISSTVVIGLVLLVGMPIATALRWLLKH